MYHPDAWKYNLVTDAEHALFAPFIRSRPELLAKAYQKARERYGDTFMRGPWPPESIFGKDVLQKEVPFDEFIEWTKDRRHIA